MQVGKNREIFGTVFLCNCLCYNDKLTFLLNVISIIITAPQAPTLLPESPIITWFVSNNYTWVCGNLWYCGSRLGYIRSQSCGSNFTCRTKPEWCFRDIVLYFQIIRLPWLRWDMNTSLKWRIYRYYTCI